MPRLLVFALAVTFSVLFSSCTKKDGRPEVWIYTSMYKDTIADIQGVLEKKFPETKFNFFQAGSEEVAAKVNAEELAGGTKADILIFSDRFWFEEMAQKGRLHKYAPKNTEKVDAVWKNKDGFYSSVSHPVMVLAYNSEAIPESQAPKTFKELADPKWKGKFATGSPLSSGTNFTSVAFLQKAYGWDYFKALRANDTIAEGGNSSVLRRLQTRERPVGLILLENLLRIQDSDKRIKVVYPEDGVIMQSNVLALAKKDTPREAAEKTADWFFSDEGQAAMVRSFMYPVIKGSAEMKGAPKLEDILKNARKWSPELVQELMRDREKIKEEFAKIMLQ